MTSSVRPLYDLICHNLFCEQQLQSYKISQKQIKEVFSWLDQRRRNLIDVSDFYAKFQDLTESQLFYVFKHLDTSRRGVLNYDDLIICLSSKDENNERSNSIKNFTSFVKILKASFHLIEEQKKKLNITKNLLEQIFNSITRGKSQNIGMMDFVVTFKEAGLQINQIFIFYLQEKLFHRSSLNLKQFIQFFAPLKWNESTRQIPPASPIVSQERREVPTFNNRAEQKIRNTENTNSQIERILQKYKNPSTPIIKNSLIDEVPLNEALDLSQKRLIPKSRDQTSKFSYEHNFEQHSSQQKYRLPERQPEVYNETSKYQFSNKFLNCSASVDAFTEINQRRQELRRGSLQRQKIMDEVLNKKRKGQFSTSQISKSTTPHSYTHPHSFGSLRIQTRAEDIEAKFYKFQENSRPVTPTLSKFRVPFEVPSYPEKQYQNIPVQKESHLTRSVSAVKTTSNFFDKSSYGKIVHYNQLVKPELGQYLKNSEASTPKSYHIYEKQNILKRAEEEATKKIEQIQKRARLKVMEKRSAAGVYNRWLK